MSTHTLPNAGEYRGGVISSALLDRRESVGRLESNVWPHERLERISAAAIVLVLHVLVIALVMLSRSAPPLNRSFGLTAFDLPDPGASTPHREIASRPVVHAAKPLPATLIPMPPPDILLNQISPMPMVQLTRIDVASLLDVTETAVATGGCDLTQPVQAALRSSPEVARQLPMIPVTSRSVANAMMIWNAGWIDGGTAPVQVALMTIRQAIMQAVAAASPECRNHLQRGPSLLYLPGAVEPASANAASGAIGPMMILALGSGQWTWQQLIDGDQPISSAALLAAGEAPPAAFAIARPSQVASGETPALNAMLASLIRKRAPTSLPYYP